LVQELFLNHLIKVNSDESVIKQSANLNAIPLKQQAIAEQFVAKRLFVKDGDGSEVATIEIAHEALISSWERLVNWIEAEKEFLLFRNHLELLYREWRESNEDERALLKDLNLEKALSFKSKLVHKEEIGFVELSFEFEEKQRRKRRNFLLGVGGVISSLGAFSAFKWFDAEEARAIASEKSIRLEKQKVLLQEEVERAKHNVGLALLEKAKLALKNNDNARANLFAYGALEVLSDRLDESSAIANVTSIIINYIPIKKAFFFNNTLFNNLTISSDSTMYILGVESSSKNQHILKIFDIKNGIFLFSFKGYTHLSSSVLISSDRKKIILGSSFDTDFNINILDIQSKKLLNKLIGHTAFIRKLYFSPNEKFVISLSNDKSIKVWDTFQGKLLYTFMIDKIKHDILSGDDDIVVSEDNHILIYSTEYTIKKWDIKTGKEIYSFDYYTDIDNFIFNTSSVDISQDLKYIARSSNSHIEIWTPKGEYIYTLQNLKNIGFTSISNNGNKILFETLQQQLNIWNRVDNKLKNISYSNSYGTIKSFIYNEELLDNMAMVKDGRTVILISSNNNFSNDKFISILDTSNEEKINNFKAHRRVITNISISEDSRYITTYSNDENIVKIWDSLSRKNIKEKKINIGFVPYIYISNNLIINYSSKEEIKILELLTGKELRVLKYKNIVEMRCLTLSKDEKIIAFTDISGKKIFIMDSISGEIIKEILFKRGYINSLALSFDGETIAVGFILQTRILIYNWKNDIKIQEFNFKNDNEISLLSLSMNSKTLLSVFQRGTNIDIWNIENKQKKAILKIDNFHNLMTIDGLSIDAIDISKNGKMVSCSIENYIQTWDISEIENFTKMEYLNTQKKLLEQQLQAKLDGIKLVPTKIPYTKPLWSKQHPNHWLLKLEGAKNKDEKAKAMYELGLIYDRDNENQTALEWYKKSAQKGYKEAEERVVFLEGWMRENS